ncbi:unnamed protein product [Mycena citricolor]|uniref:TauD/TfdA-like domain-containing protein n=1 Tax=Mycena citricolor TaxID=2018698 RepID=A0AAD2JZC2_9AGAR|nr:unnamed protein product [Mycena citricolor]
MAPVATELAQSTSERIQSLKEQAKADEDVSVFNPFYSPSIGDDGDASYEHAQYKPFFPKVSWPPLTEVEVVDRAQFADPSKKNLLGAASKVITLNPTIGTELHGIDLRQLSEAQKDELYVFLRFEEHSLSIRSALLVAERGAVCKSSLVCSLSSELTSHPCSLPRPRDRYQRTTGARPSLRTSAQACDDAYSSDRPGGSTWSVPVVYNDSSRRPDPAAFSALELWHSDVSYELQPPSTTSLKVIAGPEYGGDTLWSSGYALFSSFSPGFQKYLEGLSAVHSGVAQAEGSRAAGLHVRREPVESVHPVVRVHPVTGFKSIYVNPGFTRRIVGVPKAESDALLQLLFQQLSQNPEFQVRFRWEKIRLSSGFVDNRIVTHSATFDFWPARRHALRATPHGEKPISVAEYEASGKVAKDRRIEVWRQQGLEPPHVGGGPAKVRGYND